jgi:hypothetical protein
MKRFEEIESRISKPFVCTSTTELQEWTINTDLATWEAGEIISNELKDQKYYKIKNRIERKLHNDYLDEPQRIIRKITVKSSPMCSIDPDVVEDFWKTDGNRTSISMLMKQMISTL